MEVVLDVSGSKLSAREHMVWTRDAQVIIDKFGSRFKKARFALYVKVLAAKKLVQVRGRLITDKGQLFTSKEGWYIDQTCSHALKGIRAQLQRQAC